MERQSEAFHREQPGRAVPLHGSSSLRTFIRVPPSREIGEMSAEQRSVPHPGPNCDSGVRSDKREWSGAAREHQQGGVGQGRPTRFRAQVRTRFYNQKSGRIKSAVKSGFAAAPILFTPRAARGKDENGVAHVRKNAIARRTFGSGAHHRFRVDASSAAASGCRWRWFPGLRGRRAGCGWRCRARRSRGPRSNRRSCPCSSRR